MPVALASLIEGHWHTDILLLFVRPNLYYKLGCKSIECILLVALASLIEGHWHTDILILFMMYFNTSNVYSLL